MLFTALLALVAATAGAQTPDLQGRVIVDVLVEVGGAPYTEPSVLQLIETRAGERFSMERVRESVDHLVGLGRFEDVRVFADAVGSNGDRVGIRWVLVPVQRIAAIEIDGRPILSESELRTEINERFGTLPLTSRVPDIVSAVASYYGDRGYRRPTIEPLLSQGRSPELANLRLRIDPGPRWTIRDAAVRGASNESPAAVLDELQLARGRPFDRPALDSRVAALEDRLRELGYYEANVDIVPTFSATGEAVDIVVAIAQGPRVRVVFAGDPLPEARRDTLVPIRQERSVDLDLLEDSSRNIEVFLRQQGYRDARASYVREDQSGDLVLTFSVSRGPLHRLASIDVEGHRAVARDDIAPLLALKAGEAFSDSRINAVASAVAELYRVRGFARVAIKPELTVQPVRRDGADSVRPVTVRLVVSEGPQTLVGDVAVKGAATLPEARVTALLGLTSGRPFYRPQLDADRDAIERLYRNEGFQSARVEPRTSVADDAARLNVEWMIVEGPRVLVDRVLISGNARTSADLIRREIVLRTGSPLGEDAIIESQRRLAALGLFRRVRIVELPHGASVTRDVLIEVEEAPPTTIGYGGGIEAGRRVRTGEGSQAEERIDVAPRGFFEVSRRNLWGKNRSISLFTRVSLRPRDPGLAPEDITDTGGYGFNEYRIVGTFREPRLFTTSGDLSLTGFLEQAIRTELQLQAARRTAGLRPSHRQQHHRQRPLLARQHPLVRYQEHPSRG